MMVNKGTGGKALYVLNIEGECLALFYELLSLPVKYCWEAEWAPQLVCIYL
jgi:hypothetical protein